VDIIVDAYSCFEYMGYVVKYGSTDVMMERRGSRGENQSTSDQMLLIHSTNCFASLQPIELSKIHQETNLPFDLSFICIAKINSSELKDI
jgi:hypothetical protein